MPRPKVSILSADVIADAAMALVDSGEPFGVNAVARRIGVTPSSLYNHVDGRDAIVELMRGRLSARYMTPLPDGPWDDAVVHLLRTERRMYAEHPFLVPLIVDKTITDPAVIASYDGIATVLVDAGFPRDEVLAIVAVLDSFAIGFGLDLASPDDVWRPETPTVTLGALLEDAATGDDRSDRAFEIGLELLMESLRLRLARVRG
jgi:AcrR family transcriptional regulator